MLPRRIVPVNEGLWRTGPRQPPVPGYPSSRRRRRQASHLHFSDPGRKWASVTLAFVPILLGVAVGGPWWQETFTATPFDNSTPNQVAVITFHVGGVVSCSTVDWYIQLPCTNVSDHQNGTRGTVYAAMDYALVSLVGASTVAWLLSILGTVGIRLGRWQLRAEIAIVLAVTLVTVGLLAGSAALGPGPQANTYCEALSNNTSGCPASGARLS